MKCLALVIMPFSDHEADRGKYPEQHWKEVYGGLIRPAVEAAGLRCQRDDDDFRARPITHNIWKKIEQSDIVICDLSSSNPNVFVELGWAIRADKPYVIVVDEITTPPFDVADLNRFKYDRSLRPLYLEDEIPKLARMIRATLTNPHDACSIVRALGIPSPQIAKRARPRCAVDIYYHRRLFTQQQANAVRDALRGHNIIGRVMEHTGPGRPDAAFVGSLVEADDARLVLGMLPYELKYLFRPDYPESEGGDSSGYKIGIGYTSIYNESLRGPRGEPVSISKEQLARLIQADLTNTEFHCCLFELTLRTERRRKYK